MDTAHILLTGATGNVGSVILEQLMATGQSVNAVLRSFAKSKAFLETKYPEAVSSGRLTFTEIPDMAVPNIFHASAANASSIIHVATPLAYSDLLDSMIEPAWKFNENILNAAAASQTVTRVVITGSVVSTMRMPEDVATDKTITEADYNPITLSEALGHPSKAYQYSKTISEQKSWAHMASNKPHFDLIFILAPIITGRSPRQDYVPPRGDRLGGIARTLSYLFGIRERTFYFPYFMRVFTVLSLEAQPCQLIGLSFSRDVDDIARIHIKALEPSVPGNERYIINSGLLYLNRFANQLRDKYPELRSRIAPGAEEEGFPEPMAKFDVSKMERVFGTDWVSGFDSVEAVVKDLLAYEAVH